MSTTTSRRAAFVAVAATGLGIISPDLAHAAPSEAASPVAPAPAPRAVDVEPPVTCSTGRPPTNLANG